MLEVMARAGGDHRDAIHAQVGIDDEAAAGGAIACVGLATTLIAIVLASLPAADEPNKTLAVVKIVGGTAVLLLIGWIVKLLGTRAAARAAALPA